MREAHNFLLIQNNLDLHIHRLLRGRTISENVPKIPLFAPFIGYVFLDLSNIRKVGSFFLKIHFQIGEQKIVRKLANTSLWAGALSCIRKKSWKQKYSLNTLPESKDIQSWGCSKILLSFLMRFDSCFWLSNSNVYLSSSQFWMATPLFNFYQLPSFSKSWIPPKKVWSVQTLIPISLLHQY
jgi:hypothetical protein